MRRWKHLKKKISEQARETHTQTVFLGSLTVLYAACPLMYAPALYFSQPVLGVYGNIDRPACLVIDISLGTIGKMDAASPPTANCGCS